jgi:hypothetical protein
MSIDGTKSRGLDTLWPCILVHWEGEGEHNQMYL